MDIFKINTDTSLNEEALVKIGNMIEVQDIVITTLLDWADKKERDLMKEVLGLATNPDISERVIGIYLGEIRAVKKELTDFLRVCHKKYKDNKKKKEEKTLNK